MDDDNPFKAKPPNLSPEDQKRLKAHVKINRSGGIVEVHPGDAVVVFRHDMDVARMPDIIIPADGGQDIISRVNACKVLYLLTQLNDKKSLTKFGDSMEEAWEEFRVAVTDSDLDAIAQYEVLTPGFISPGSDEIH